MPAATSLALIRPCPSLPSSCNLSTSLDRILPRGISDLVAAVAILGALQKTLVQHVGKVFKLNPLHWATSIRSVFRARPFRFLPVPSLGLPALGKLSPFLPHLALCLPIPRRLKVRVAPENLFPIKHHQNPNSICLASCLVHASDQAARHSSGISVLITTSPGALTTVKHRSTVSSG